MKLGTWAEANNLFQAAGQLAANVAGSISKQQVDVARVEADALELEAIPLLDNFRYNIDSPALLDAYAPNAGNAYADDYERYGYAFDQYAASKWTELQKTSKNPLAIKFAKENYDQLVARQRSTVLAYADQKRDDKIVLGAFQNAEKVRAGDMPIEAKIAYQDSLLEPARSKMGVIDFQAKRDSLVRDTMVSYLDSTARKALAEDGSDVDKAVGVLNSSFASATSAAAGLLTEEDRDTLEQRLKQEARTRQAEEYSRKAKAEDASYEAFGKKIITADKDSVQLSAIWREVADDPTLGFAKKDDLKKRTLGAAEYLNSERQRKAEGDYQVHMGDLMQAKKWDDLKVLSGEILKDPGLEGDRKFALARIAISAAEAAIEAQDRAAKTAADEAERDAKEAKATARTAASDAEEKLRDETYSRARQLQAKADDEGLLMIAAEVHAFAPELLGTSSRNILLDATEGWVQAKNAAMAKAAKEAAEEAKKIGEADQKVVEKTKKDHIDFIQNRIFNMMGRTGKYQGQIEVRASMQAEIEKRFAGDILGREEAIKAMNDALSKGAEEAEKQFELDYPQYTSGKATIKARVKNTEVQEKILTEYRSRYYRNGKPSNDAEAKIWIEESTSIGIAKAFGTFEGYLSQTQDDNAEAVFGSAEDELRIKAILNPDLLERDGHPGQVDAITANALDMFKELEPRLAKDATATRNKNGRIIITAKTKNPNPTDKSEKNNYGRDTTNLYTLEKKSDGKIWFKIWGGQEYIDYKVAPGKEAATAKTEENLRHYEEYSSTLNLAVTGKITAEEIKKKNFSDKEKEELIALLPKAIPAATPAKESGVPSVPKRTGTGGR